MPPIEVVGPSEAPAVGTLRAILDADIEARAGAASLRCMSRGSRVPEIVAGRRLEVARRRHACLLAGVAVIDESGAAKLARIGTLLDEVVQARDVEAASSRLDEVDGAFDDLVGFLEAQLAPDEQAELDEDRAAVNDPEVRWHPVTRVLAAGVDAIRAARTRYTKLDTHAPALAPMRFRRRGLETRPRRRSRGGRSLRTARDGPARPRPDDPDELAPAGESA